MMSLRIVRRIRRDESGNVLVEATVMMAIILTFILGGIDFLFAFYQYNAAAKAVELGARIAAVWDPVSNGLPGLSTAVLASTNAGSPMPAFTVTCTPSSNTAGSCTCTGTCTGITNGTSDFNLSALQAMVYGRGNSGSCNASGSGYTLGMCGLFRGIDVKNVVVVYTQSGMGYAGRPGGPVPTITVSLQNVPFNFYFLGGLLGFANVTMPPLTTSITGEYMSSSAPS